MKVLFNVLLLLALSQCSYHFQETSTVLPEEKIEEVGEETNPLQKLLNSITSGDLDNVKNSIEVDGLDINSFSADGFPLIMVAIRQRQFEIMEYLVQKGADLTLVTRSEEFPEAVDTFGYVDSLTLSDEERGIYSAILKGEAIDEKALGQFLFLTIQVLQEDLFLWLLKKEADPNFVSKPPAGGKKTTPLVFLLNKGFDPATDQKSFKSQEAMFEALVTHPQIDLNKKVKGRTALKAVKFLIFKFEHYKAFDQRLRDLGATK